MGTSAIVFVFMSTFLSHAMIRSSLWHIARAKLYAKIVSKSQNKFICSTMQCTTILFQYFQKTTILVIFPLET